MAPYRRNPPAPSGVRGVVRGFSTDSRRRLRLAVMAVDWDCLESYWVTLTYHRAWSEDWQGWKGDCRRFRQRLARRWGPAGGVWRLEFQRRGAPHFHLVCSWSAGCRPDGEAFAAWVARNWSDVIGESSRAHRRHGTRVDEIYNTSGSGLGKLLGYLVKELGKVRQSEDVPAGRIWGRFGDLPTRVLEDLELTDEGYCELARRVAEQGSGWWADRVSGAWPGLVVLGSGPGLRRLLEDLPGGVRRSGGGGSAGG